MTKTYILHQLIPHFDTGPCKVAIDSIYIHCYWLKGLRSPNSTYPCQYNHQNIIGTGSSLFEDNRLQSNQFTNNTDPLITTANRKLGLFQKLRLVALRVLVRPLDQSVCAETEGRSKTNIALHLTFPLFVCTSTLP